MRSWKCQITAAPVPEIEIASAPYRPPELDTWLASFFGPCAICERALRIAGSGARFFLRRRVRTASAYAAFRPTESSASSLGAINLGRHEFGRVGHSHLQGARKRQADHDEGAGQHTDRDQSAFAVALHNKGPTVG